MFIRLNFFPIVIFSPNKKINIYFIKKNYNLGLKAKYCILLLTLF